MKIRRVIVGELETNCYILEEDGQALIIDPGSDLERIREEIGELKPIKVLLTHKHFDHIGAFYDIIDMYKIESFNERKEKEYRVGPFTFEVILTKGHTKDSVSYYFKEYNSMFVGDFVFKGTIGRTDFEGGSMLEMRESIEKLKSYPKDTILYPGHGESTTIGEEIKNNPYF